MSFRDALASAEFVVTAELGPPVDPDPDAVRRTARALAPVVHAANVTDNQAATVKLSPLACSVWMLEEGLEPILQMTTRDRNVLALQADLLGAWALGVRTLLALGGDPLRVGLRADREARVRRRLPRSRAARGRDERRPAGGRRDARDADRLSGRRRGESARGHDRAAGAEDRLGC